MAQKENEKNEKNEKLFTLFQENKIISTLYKYEKNLDSGKEYITLNDRGYKKLSDFILNQDNITTYKINAYYIERFNDMKKEYIENVEINGVKTTRTHFYYSRLSSDDIAYKVFKTVLDDM